MYLILTPREGQWCPDGTIYSLDYLEKNLWGYDVNVFDDADDYIRSLNNGLIEMHAGKVLVVPIKYL